VRLESFDSSRICLRRIRLGEDFCACVGLLREKLQVPSSQMFLSRFLPFSIAIPK
jgi:hypothetical protein